MLYLKGKIDCRMYWLFGQIPNKKTSECVYFRETKQHLDAYIFGEQNKTSRRKEVT